MLNITNLFVCDVCHFVKQKRLSFPISTSKSKKCFDLIHVDIGDHIQYHQFMVINIY